MSVTFAPFYGYPADLIAQWCAVTPRTAARWKAGTARPSPAHLKLFRIHRDEQVLGPQWKNWVVRGENLVDPEGASLSRAQLHGYWLIVQFARELARESSSDAYEAFQRLLA